METITKEASFSTFLPLKDSKQDLILQRNELCTGKFEARDCDLGNGKIKKKPKRMTSSESSSEEDEDTKCEKQRKKSKKTSEKSKLKQAEDMAKSLKEQMYGNKDQHESNIQNQKDTIRELRRQLEECRRENQTLLDTIKLFKAIPNYMESFEALVNSADAATARLQRPNETVPRTTQGPAVYEPDQEQSKDKISSLMSRCSKQDFKKFTSDLLVAVFGREKLATHSMTGGRSCKVEGKAKEPLDPKKLEFVINEVLKAFPSMAKEHIKMTITNKLSNESKMKRKRESKIIEEE